MLRVFCFALVLLLANVASAGGTQAPPPDPGQDVCPTLDAANSRVQARAQLIAKAMKNMGQDKPFNINRLVAESEGQPPSVNIYVALADIVVARAKEEGRVWLLQEISDQLCAGHTRDRQYFPNICQVAKVDSYPGPSISLIRTRLRRDIYALPACYMYLKDSAATKPDAANDSAIDPYLVEATLLQIYASTQGTSSDPDAPKWVTTGDPPTDQDLADLLVGAVVAKLKLIQQSQERITPPESCPYTKNPHTSVKALVDKVRKLVKGGMDSYKAKKPVMGVPDAAVAAIRDTLTTLCGPTSQAVTEFNQIANVYIASIQGNFTEAAFVASDNFLCNDPNNKPTYCSRLPRLAEVAMARSDEDMKSALDQAIDPVGSWKRKQAEDGWSLDSMVGFAVGNERLTANGESGDGHTTYGAYVPVGVEYSWATPTAFCGKLCASTSVGVTLLDLGALVSYSDQSHVNGGQSSSAPNATWSTLTSPGAYVAFGVKNTPIRFGLSWSRTPQLRAVANATGPMQSADSTRVMAFIAFDITLFSGF